MMNIEKSPMLLGSCRLQRQIEKTASGTWFSSENTFVMVNLPAVKMEIFINFSDSEENGNNVDVTGCILISYV